MGCAVSSRPPESPVEPQFTFAAGSPLCHVAMTSADFERCAETRSESVSIRVYLSQNGGWPGDCFRAFSTEKALHYDPLCDDFGPMSILCVTRFIGILDDQIAACSDPHSKVLVYCVPDGARALTNAVFLLGSYMILKLGMTPSDLTKRFGALHYTMLEGYRDATYFEADFRLSLLDCWQGLQRGKALGWISCPSSPTSTKWGLIDIARHAYFDNPLIADLTEVVPGKYIAFPGPVSSVNEITEAAPAAPNGVRQFTVDHYVPILKQLGVSTVIRLNENYYDRDELVRAGFDHLDLTFDDCTPPTPEMVSRFLVAAEAAPGRVAVHCRAGLGRTGTMIAVDMMRTHGFAAREAIAWLRILRPGSVIGLQQHYLCAVEDHYRRRPGKPPRAAESSPRAAAAPAVQPSGLLVCPPSASDATSEMPSVAQSPARLGPQPGRKMAQGGAGSDPAAATPAAAVAGGGSDVAAGGGVLQTVNPSHDKTIAAAAGSGGGGHRSSSFAAAAHGTSDDAIAPDGGGARGGGTESDDSDIQPFKLLSSLARKLSWLGSQSESIGVTRRGSDSDTQLQVDPGPMSGRRQATRKRTGSGLGGTGSGSQTPPGLDDVTPFSHSDDDSDAKTATNLKSGGDSDPSLSRHQLGSRARSVNSTLSSPMAAFHSGRSSTLDLIRVFDDLNDSHARRNSAAAGGGAGAAGSVSPHRSRPGTPEFDSDGSLTSPSSPMATAAARAEYAAAAAEDVASGVRRRTDAFVARESSCRTGSVPPPPAALPAAAGPEMGRFSPSQMSR